MNKNNFIEIEVDDIVMNKSTKTLYLYYYKYSSYYWKNLTIGSEVATSVTKQRLLSIDFIKCNSRLAKILYL